MLSKALIIDCLRQLGDELVARGLQGELLLTGGAAMCLVHEARDMTKDVDALYEPKAVINDIARQIAERNGLPSDWLNDGVKGFIGDNAPIEDYLVLNGLRVQAVSTEYLLAMKLMSSRYGEMDYQDIRFLLRKLDITSVDQAHRLLTTFFTASRILPKTMYVIEDILADG
ncbi:MAG: DUF6036 family nucleotidyltransferase [Clostridiales bacterium]|nr:DUF6036 family nucleotidyltransferase [Clostridiales bacterium]